LAAIKDEQLNGFAGDTSPTAQLPLSSLLICPSPLLWEKKMVYFGEAAVTFTHHFEVMRRK